MDHLSPIVSPQPRPCPEDLAENLRLAERLAPIHCTGCGGYHLARARRRVQPGGADALDRPEIVALLRAELARRDASAHPADITIAGSGDTNLLAICADAAALTAIAPRRVRYSVVDRCRTPLLLCEAFAQTYDLDLRVAQTEMGEDGPAFPADLILAHSLLRFVPADRHRATLRQLRGWLKPGGVMVFSHRLMAPAPGAGEYGDAAELVALLGAAGLGIVTQQQHHEEIAAPGRDLPRHRFLALLRAA